jgi:hypothetical protein
MGRHKERRDELLDQIIGLELDMFLAVRAQTPSLCQEQPETFNLMRRMTHSALSDETLEAYLGDLSQATVEGRNLLTEKYARMDRLIPCLNRNPVIDQIVDLELRWLQELSGRYPQMFKPSGAQRSDVYLRCELETYSDRTLELYSRDVLRAAEEDRNLAAERYTFLAKLLGYSCIDDLARRRSL